MKKTLLRITSMTLALLMAFSVFAGAVGETKVTQFSDFPNDWSVEAMTFAVENGLLKGYENNTIAPAKNMTRAEMATVINRAFKAWKTANISFSDVSAGDWFYSEVSKAVAFETFKGTSTTNFTPNGNITRAQAFTAIARALKLIDADENAMNAFGDAATVPSWAKAETAAMVTAGYVQGANGNLRPNDPLTRAEFAQLMYNIINAFAEDATVETNGNLLVTTNGLNLSNMVIEGDLIVGANVTALTLKNVIITGRLLVRDQYDLALNVTGSSVQGGLVAYAPNQVVTVTTDNIPALQENLRDYTTVIFKKKSSSIGGNNYNNSGAVTKYLVTASTVANGRLSVSPAYAAQGEMVTVVAIPDAGYELEQILVNGNPIVGTTFAALAEDMVVSATFKAIEYNVNVTAPQNGTLTVSPAKATIGTTVTVTATPDAGYKLDGVYVNGDKITGNTFVMPAGDVTITAEFSELPPNYYSVNIGMVENGTVVVSDTSAKKGDTITVTATPNAGYKLSAIKVNGTAITGNTFVMPEENVTVTAEFTAIQYNVAVTAPANGTLTADLANAIIGTTVTVTATPDAGYKLDGIYVNGNKITGNTFVMPAGDVTITAEFTAIEYNVSVVAPANGILKTDLTKATIGTVVTVTATPDAGYKLSAIKVNGTAITGNTFVMSAEDVTVTAEFTAIPYGVTVTAPTNGTLAADLANATIGTTVTVTATPDAGYKLSAIKVNGTAITGNTFVMPAGDVTITAEFEAIEYTITVDAPQNGALVVSANKAIIGTTITVSATPNTGYKLDGIYVNGSKISGTSFVMPAQNVTVSAKFSELPPNYYSVNVGTVENGALAVTPNYAKKGDTITVLATPDAGYKLSVIKVNGSAISGNTFTMPGETVTVTAEFTAIEYNVTVVAPENGTLAADLAKATIGTTVTVTATPDEGFELSAIKVNGTAITGNTFVMPAGNVTVTAEFTAIEYTITAVAPANGTLKTDLAKATKGTTITVTATPNAGYSLIVIKVNGAAITGNTFVMPAENVTVTAEFDVLGTDEYSITVVPSENGTVEPNVTSAAEGALVTLTVTPKKHYRLNKLMVNGTAITGTSFTMPAGNVTITATFKAIPYAIRIHYPDTRYAFLLDVPYTPEDTLFTLSRKILEAAHGPDGGLLLRLWNDGFDKIHEKGYLINNEIPKYQVEDHREYDVNVNLYINSETDIDANDLSGEIADALQPDVYDNLSATEQADIFDAMVDEVRAELKATSAEEKRDWLLRKLPQYEDDSFAKLLLERIPAADIADAYDTAIDEIPDSAFSLKHEVGSTHYIICVQHQLNANEFVDGYFVEHLEAEIIDDCREGMKAMTADDMREWLATRLPASAYSKAMKVFNKIPDRDFTQLFSDGVDMVPYEAFTVIHIPGDKHYSIDMVWDCDPITFADNYYTNVYLKNRVLDKLAAYDIVPNSEEWALYDRFLPSNFVKNMGTHHTLLTFSEYYEDLHEILDLAEAAFRSRSYEDFYGERAKVIKAIEKGIPKGLDKAREKGIEVVDENGVDITAEQCIAAAKALYADVDITVNDLIDIFGSDYVRVAGGARGHDTEIMVSRIDRSKE